MRDLLTFLVGGALVALTLVPLRARSREGSIPVWASRPSDAPSPLGPPTTGPSLALLLNQWARDAACVVTCLGGAGAMMLGAAHLAIDAPPLGHARLVAIPEALRLGAVGLVCLVALAAPFVVFARRPWSLFALRLREVQGTERLELLRGGHVVESLALSERFVAQTVRFARSRRGMTFSYVALRVVQGPIDWVLDTGRAPPSGAQLTRATSRGWLLRPDGDWTSLERRLDSGRGVDTEP